MRNLKIKTKLFIAMLITTLFFLGLNTYLTYITAKGELIKESIGKGISKAVYNASEIDSFFKENTKIVNLTGLFLGLLFENQPEDNYDDMQIHHEASDYLQIITEKHKDTVNGITYAFIEKEMFDMENYVIWWAKAGDSIDFVQPDFSQYNYRNAEWYKVPYKTRDFFWSNPYIFKNKAGKQIKMITVSKDIFNRLSEDKKVLAIAKVDIELDYMFDIVEKIKMGKTSQAFLISQDGLFISHHNKDYILNKNARDIKDSEEKEIEGWTAAVDTMLSKVSKSGTKEKDYSPGFTELTYLGKDMFLFYAKIPTTHYSLGILIEKDEVLDGVRSMTFRSIIIMVVATIFVFFIIYFLSHTLIAKPIDKLLTLINEMADGNLSGRTTIDSQDEIGHISERFNFLSESMREIVLQIGRTAKKISDSGRNVFSSVDTANKAFVQMNDSVEAERSSYNNLNALIIETVNKINSTLSAVDSVAESINHQATVVDDSSTAIEEMVQSIQSVNHISNEADEISKNLVLVTKEGETAVKRVVEAGQEVGESSKQISEMVGLISNISEQTNLLAMNAAIEAAHAGQYGKGFAVVADEIRKLAENSGNSARDITNIIKEVTQKIDNSVKLGQHALEGFNLILSDVERTARINAEISTATEEQAKGAEEILKSISSLLTITDQVKTATQEQKKGNKEIYDSLTTIRQDSAIIAIEIDTQVEKSHVILQETKAINLAVEENLIISRLLEGLIMHFDIMDDEAEEGENGLTAWNK